MPDMMLIGSLCVCFAASLFFFLRRGSGHRIWIVIILFTALLAMLVPAILDKTGSAFVTLAICGAMGVAVLALGVALVIRRENIKKLEEERADAGRTRMMRYPVGLTKHWLENRENAAPELIDLAQADADAYSPALSMEESMPKDLEGSDWEEKRPLVTGAHEPDNQPVRAPSIGTAEASPIVLNQEETAICGMEPDVDGVAHREAEQAIGEAAPVDAASAGMEGTHEPPFVVEVVESAPLPIDEFIDAQLKQIAEEAAVQRDVETAACEAEPVVADEESTEDNVAFVAADVPAGDGAVEDVGDEPDQDRAAETPISGNAVADIASRAEIRNEAGEADAMVTVAHEAEEQDEEPSSATASASAVDEAIPEPLPEATLSAAEAEAEQDESVAHDLPVESAMADQETADIRADDEAYGKGKPLVEESTLQVAPLGCVGGHEAEEEAQTDVFVTTDSGYDEEIGQAVREDTLDVASPVEDAAERQKKERENACSAPTRTGDEALLDHAFALTWEKRWSEAADAFLAFREGALDPWARKQADFERLAALIEAERVYEAIDLIFFILDNGYDLSSYEREQIVGILELLHRQ